MRTARLAIIGLGNVGRRLLELIDAKRETLRTRYDLDLSIVGATDTSGAALSADGLDIGQVLACKRSQKGIADYARFGRAGMTSQDLIGAVQADVMVELSLTNLKDGEPGLSTIRQALLREMDVVTANKGPLVVAYAELVATARAKGVKLLFSATVTGGLPTLNIGRRDLGPATIEKFEGVVNATSNYVLSRMSEGQAFQEALQHAQELGMAEADPALDIDGWDAACKLVIIANAVMNYPATLKDVSVQGIRAVMPADLEQAANHRQVIKLMAVAEKIGNAYDLSVRPTRLELAHPLARVGAGMMGVMYHTDINGTIVATIEENDPYPTAAAVLRNIVEIAGQEQNAKLAA